MKLSNTNFFMMLRYVMKKMATQQEQLLQRLIAYNFNSKLNILSLQIFL
jgi:hypothetical protein